VISAEPVQRAVPYPGHFAGIDAQAAPYRVYVYAACTVLAVALNYVFGKEMAWDQLHYHFYSGFSALNDRFGQDYFAAGPQSYFNPYAYVPFYVLVKLGLPGLAVGTVLAMLHSVVLWLTYELACRVCSSEDRKERLFFGLCATALALMNPVFLQQIGSSFADITTAGLILGGWLLLAQAVRCPRTTLIIFGGILLGLATTLKPTNGVHALAGFFLVAFVPLPFLGRIRYLFYLGAALGTSFVLTAAPWSYRLTRMFGNPMFPLLNNVFKSPEITTASPKAYRFIPDSLTEALLRPFEISGTGGMIHEELSSPDIRYALLLLVFLIFVISYSWQSIRRASIPVAAPHSESATRVLAALGCGFVADWIVWLSGSGNSRYFIPMACVAAVLAVALLFRLLANHAAGRNGILLALLAAQGAQLALGTDYRWNPAPWIGRWFNVEIPERLAAEPNLYLSMGGPSNSFLVPFLAKGSGFVNFSGSYVLGPDGATASHVRAMIRSSEPNLRVLVSGEEIFPDAAGREPRQSDVDDILRTFGLRVDMSDCESIMVKGLRSTPWRAFDSSIPAPPIPRYGSRFATCHLVHDTRDQSQEASARRAADVVLNHLEDACPALFQPPRPQSEHVNQVWFRRYGATDLTAWVGNGEVKFIDATRDPHEIVVGRDEAWAKGSLPLECGRRHGIYFARLTPAG
jgi:Glycosyltransferase family 87